VPETVQSIEVVRGPFNIECGDSNLGGCVNITTKTSEPFARVGISGGNYLRPPNETYGLRRT
jgi:outer membrane receptor protein involved in Fe transport